MYKAPSEPSDVQKLWTQVKETESLYKLVEHLSSLPPSERRDSLLTIILGTINSPVKSDGSIAHLNGRIRDLELQITKAERERDEANDYVDQLRCFIEKVGQQVPKHDW